MTATRAEWPAPERVEVFTTRRHGIGHSLAPFDTFNLGLRSGDDATTVERNRADLIRHFALPSAPRWLRQVHGTHVAIEPGATGPSSLKDNGVNIYSIAERAVKPVSATR